MIEVRPREELGELAEIGGGFLQEGLERFGRGEIGDVGELDVGEEPEQEAGLGGAAGAGAAFGQLFEVFAEAGELEDECAGVGFVDQEQVEDEVGLHGGLVAGARGEGAVGDFEDGFEFAAVDDGVSGEGVLEKFDHLERSFEAAADIEEAPAFAAGHAFEGEAGEGRQGDDGLVEEVEGGAEVLFVG